MALFERLLEEGKQKAAESLGGMRRLQVIVVLASTLGLDSADKAAVSAVADRLKTDLSLSNADIGVLLAVVSFVGAVVTLPAGVLADRLSRRKLLLATVATWAAAMAASGFADSFAVLLGARVFLGAVTAAAWPCIASLSGDLFAARERASIYGLILTGELAGTAIGFFISTEAAALGGWHWSFFALVVPSVVLVWAIWKYLPEPERGAQGWLTDNEDEPKHEGTQDEKPNPAEIADAAPDIEPEQSRVAESDPRKMGWIGAMRFCLEVATYRRLVIVSALAYFFFSGVRGFGMIYFQEHFGLQHSGIILATAIIGVAALVGIVMGGRLSERLLARGYLPARVVIPAVALFVAVPFIGFGIWTRSPWLGISLLAVGGASLALALAPVDAGRLDVIPAHLWGRAESGRAALRYLFEGASPLLIGAVSTLIGGSRNSNGLEWAFLIALVSLLAAAVLAVPLRRTYGSDVATAAASARRFDVPDESRGR